jgi:uncharacterized protein (TIGR02246 family)
MNPRLFAAASLAIGFAVPALAQEKVGPCTGPGEACQQVVDLVKDWNAVVKKQDAAAVAALYTQDAVLVTEGPIFHGREAVEKFYIDSFKAGFSNTMANTSEFHVTGDIAWAFGDWTATGPAPSPKTTQPYHGNWVNIFAHSDGAWKIRLDTWNVIEAPAQ